MKPAPGTPDPRRRQQSKPNLDGIEPLNFGQQPAGPQDTTPEALTMDAVMSNATSAPSLQTEPTAGESEYKTNPSTTVLDLLQRQSAQNDAKRATIECPTLIDPLLGTEVTETPVTDRSVISDLPTPVKATARRQVPIAQMNDTPAFLPTQPTAEPTRLTPDSLESATAAPLKPAAEQTAKTTQSTDDDSDCDTDAPLKPQPAASHPKAKATAAISAALCLGAAGFGLWATLTSAAIGSASVQAFGFTATVLTGIVWPLAIATGLIATGAAIYLMNKNGYFDGMKRCLFGRKVDEDDPAQKPLTGNDAAPQM